MKRVLNIGLLGAILGASCCTIPLLLVFVGLGGLGFSRFFTEYHWWLQGAGAILLAIAWWVFLRERRRIRGLGARVRNERLTMSVLSVATLVLVGFLGFNLKQVFQTSRHQLATASGPASTGESTARAVSDDAHVPAGAAVSVIAVEGMTCASCELIVEKTIRDLPGVINVDANATTGEVRVVYWPDKVNPELIMKTLQEKTAYRPQKVLRTTLASASRR